MAKTKTIENENAETENMTQEETSENLLDSITLKRSVTVKTLVTDEFKEKALGELNNEVSLIDQQTQQLENQYQQTIKQLEGLATQGRNVAKEMEQLNREVNNRRQQLSSLRMEVTSKLANLDKVPNGSFIVTGMLENYVEVNVGDNIYDKIKNAEIIVKDGHVTAIKG